jgi:adenylate cyclase
VTEEGESPGPDLVADVDVGALTEGAEQLMLGGPRRYTRAEVADISGINPDVTRRLWRSLGFAVAADDEVMFTDGDVAALQLVNKLVETGIADDETLAAMTRMMGQSFARLASGQGQLIMRLLANNPQMLRSEDEVLRLFGQLLPVIEQIQSYVWRRQLAAYFARVAHGSIDTSTPTLVSMAVGFADMSGFTSLTRRATESELGELLETFESVTTEVVGAHGGRIVKTIGDEVFFTADTAATCAEIGLDLLDTAEQHEVLPPLRIGLAAGPVVVRLGDVYGSTVNIASRLTTLSRPGWILVDRVMAESLADDGRYSLKPRRPESVRGFHHLRQWRLRRVGEGRPAPRKRGHANRGR